MTACPAAPSRPVFAIFQGGGADGVAHLGAIAALEDEGLEMIGVAGASAGAFVAALVAAGYRGKELFNPETKGSDLLSRYGKEPLDLLGRDRWGELNGLRSFARALPSVLARRWWDIPVLFPILRVLRAFWPYRKVTWRTVRMKGHFDASAVREFVNWALREKLRDAFASAGDDPSNVPDRIRFVDLDPVRFPQFRPLKIIATDVTNRQAELFSQADNATTEVGAAVAASISIPGAFQPVTLAGLPGSLFADGGLVSNLPAWTFLEDKLAYERSFPNEDRVPILAFTLASPPAVDGSGTQPPQAAGKVQASVVGDALAYASDVVRAGIFGSQAIGQRLVSDVVVITLRPALGVLGFDPAWRRILDCVNDGRRGATNAFANSLRLRPDRVRAELKQAAEGAMLRAVPPANPRTPPHSCARCLTAGSRPVSRVRACLVVPAGSASLRVAATYGAQTEADDNLLLDRSGPGSARAFLEKDVRIAQVERDAAGRPKFTEAARMSRYEAALMWKDLRSIVSVPILRTSTDWALDPSDRKEEPLGVLCIDSDGDLGPAMEETDLMDWLVERSVVLNPLLQRGTW